MSDTPFQIEEIFTIKDLDTLKVVADPLRIRILEFFSDETPHTVKQISRALEIAPNKLYYHVNMLEECGLLHVVDTRIVSGIIEKLYMVVAHTITVDPNLLSPSGSAGDNEALVLMVDTMLDETKRSIFESARAGLIATDEADPQKKLIISSMVGKLRPEDAHEFIRRFQALMKEFADRDDEDGKAYRLTFALFPSVDHPDNEDE